MFMKFLILSWISTRHFFRRQSFVQPFFATDNTTVVSVKPETERQGDSCASAINETAGVDVGYSGQGNKVSIRDGDRRECVFCSSCVTCVRQQCLGHGQDARKRNSGIRKKLYRTFQSMMNMHGAWLHPLYVCKKETAMCPDYVNGTVVHVLRDHSRVCSKVS